MELQEVLIAEDEPMIRLIIEEALQEAGYSVCASADGAEALACLEQPDQHFVAVVTDIRMPGSTSGWDVARRARELRPDVAVIYVSADGEPDWTSQGVPESVFVQKPFAQAQIVTALSNLLNKTS